MSQEELAKRANSTQGQINKIETGVSKRPRNIKKLAEVLEVSPAWLLFGMEELDQLSKDAVALALDWETLDPAKREAVANLVKSLK